MLLGSLDIPLMTLLSQTIAFVAMAASSLWSRAGEAVETAREARRGGRASTALCGEAQLVALGAAWLR